MLFWHRQETRVDALSIVPEAESGFGDVSKHCEVDSLETNTDKLISSGLMVVSNKFK